MPASPKTCPLPVHAHAWTDIPVTSRAGRRTYQADTCVANAPWFRRVRHPFALLVPSRDFERHIREGEFRDSEARSRGSTGHRVRLPRQGQHRELKKAIEGYWKGRVAADTLLETAKDLRRSNWQQLAGAGIHEVPTGDFSYYDHVLDTSVMVGAVPDRHRDAVAADALDGYFAMARGTQDVAPLEMTKWFDTNYHYLVPELGPDTVFSADSGKQVAELKEALALGLAARPVLVGPVTYLLLSKPAPGVAADFEPLTLLDRLLPVYAEVLADLRAAGAEWVQLDEPALVQDRTPAELNAATRAYRDLGTLTDRPKLLVASYFDRLGDALPVLAKAPVDGLALDFTDAAAANLDALAAVGGLPGKRLVAGVVNGRNIWINDLENSLATLGTLLGLADRVDVAASCSLLHVPLDAAVEREIDPQIVRWLAFAKQKTAELVTLARGLAQGTDTIAAELAANRADLASRATSALTHDPAVRAGRRPSPTPTAAAHNRTPIAPPPSAPTSGCRCCRPRPSVRSRRPPSCAPPVPICEPDGSTPPATRSASGRRSATSSPSRRRPESMSSCTASPSATTWSSTSPSSSPATSPPNTAGCSPTGPATSARRCSPGTSPPRADDGPLDPVRPVAHRPPGQGHAHRPGHHARLVLRPRRPAARGHRPPGGTRPARRGQRPRQLAPRSSRSTSPPCARRSRCARPTTPRTWPGPPRRSASPPAGYRTAPRSTPTCATPSSATSCRPSTTSTRTSSAWRPPAPTCR